MARPIDALLTGMTLPAVCAPMFLVSGPALVAEACSAGLMAVLPAHNARDAAELDTWLGAIRTALDAHEQRRGTPAGPLAVNLPGALDDAQLAERLAACRRHGVAIIVNAQGDPAAIVRRVHDWGGFLLHDITTVRFAQKAIAAGVDGLICIGAGGGGHSGTLSPLVMIPRLRALFDGLIVMAGAVADGAAIRAAEILGADLAYLGTRFIATRESLASDAYKRMLVAEDATGLAYTRRIAGIAGNWLVPSLRAAGLDPADLPAPPARKGHDHLPRAARPWHTLWSAGQGIELIADIPAVADVVARLRREYDAACARPPLAAFGIAR